MGILPTDIIHFPSGEGNAFTRFFICRKLHAPFLAAERVFFYNEPIMIAEEMSLWIIKKPVR